VSDASIDADHRILLNIGSGAPGGGLLPALFASWRQLRVDLDPAVAPDVLADIVDLSPIPSGVADAVWTAHCVEHLYEHDVPAALGEIRRVLKDDGFACILVPDLQTIAGYIAQDRMHEPLYISPAGPVTPHDVVFGFGPAIADGRLTMAHRCGFTPAAMTRCLQAAGFGGYALLRRANFELAAIVRRQDWGDPAERDALIADLGL
jgi:SAM-dependent methyltransferase